MHTRDWLRLLLSIGWFSMGNSNYQSVNWPNMLTPDLIRAEGYPSETHTIQTADCYLLDIHRIRHAPNRTSARGVVLLMHGVLTSSACWVVSGIAFYFSDQGYDVWMGNVRGNTYGKKHAHMSPDDDKFWAFTMDEIALYDVPATIDYILHTTSKRTLTYTGHSMGTAVFFEMVSELPEYNKKIDLFVGLSAAAFMGQMRSPVKYAAAYADDIAKITQFFGQQFSPENTLTALVQSFCDLEEVTSEICIMPIFFIVGYDRKLFDPEMIPIIEQKCIDSTSGKLMHHISQRIFFGRFAKYDYGEEENMKRYNSSKSPDFDLSNIKIPLALFTGDNDLLDSPEDNKLLRGGLTNARIVRNYMVPFVGFNHLDFVFAKEAIDLVYVEVLRIMKMCTNGKCGHRKKIKWRLFG